MAEDDKRAVGGPKDYQFSTLNNVSVPKSIDPKYDPHTAGYYDMERRLQKDHFTPNALQSRGSWIGVVLRVVDDASGSADPGSWYSLSAIKDLLGSENVGLQILRVMIPELHAMSPIPDKFGDVEEQGSHHGRINNFYSDVFVSETTQTPLAKPGDLVHVDYGDQVNFTDGVYLGLVSGGLPAEDESAASGKDAHKKNAKEPRRLGPEGEGHGTVAADTPKISEDDLKLQSRSVIDALGGISTGDADWVIIVNELEKLGSVENINNFKLIFQQMDGDSIEEELGEEGLSNDFQREMFQRAIAALNIGGT